MINKIVSYLREVWRNRKNPPFIVRYELLSLVYFALGIKKDVVVRLFDDDYVFPLNPNSMSAIRETFTLEVYSKLKGCKNILDLGGFLGESAIWLSKYNKNITVYEASKLNFGYLEKNLLSNKNVTCHSGAIVGDPTVKMINFGSNGFDLGGKIKDSGDTVSATFIGDIDQGYDGLKMDIEGEEYRIINYYISAEAWPYECGYIEFHSTLEQENNDNIKKFCDFLKNYGFQLKWYIANDSTSHEFNDELLSNEIVVAYFYKNSL